MNTIEYPNILSQNISTADKISFYDASCKRLLSSKIILAWILKSCLKEFRNYGAYEIAEKYIKGEPYVSTTAVYPDGCTGDEASQGKDTGSEIVQGTTTEDVTIQEGTVTYDIRFLACYPASEEWIYLLLDVEAQNDFYPGYPIVKRGIYYGSRMISSQYGVEFSKSQYGKIKKVCSIWICMNPPQWRKNTINEYCLSENHLVGDVKEDKQKYDLMAVFILCLGDEHSQNYCGILKLLEVLLSPRRTPEEKKRILQEEFGIVMTTEMEREVIGMKSLGQGIADRAYTRGIAHGISQGVSRGIEQGRIQGIEQNIVQNIRNLMHNMNWSAEQSVAALGVPEKDRKYFLEKVKHEE